MALIRGGGRWVWLEEVGHWRYAFEVSLPLLLSLSAFWLPGIERLCSTTPLHHDTIPHHKSTVMWPSQHGLKLGDKINLKLFCSGICYSNGKLTNTNGNRASISHAREGPGVGPQRLSAEKENGDSGTGTWALSSCARLLFCQGRIGWARKQMAETEVVSWVNTQFFLPVFCFHISLPTFVCKQPVYRDLFLLCSDHTLFYPTLIS
jgi:hypothetical protein